MRPLQILDKSLVFLRFAPLALLALFHFLTFLNAFGDEKAFALVLAQNAIALNFLCEASQQGIKAFAVFLIYIHSKSPLSALRQFFRTSLPAYLEAVS